VNWYSTRCRELSVISRKLKDSHTFIASFLPNALPKAALLHALSSTAVMRWYVSDQIRLLLPAAL
jgi:hypothetical protein